MGQTNQTNQLADELIRIALNMKEQVATKPRPKAPTKTSYRRRIEQLWLAKYKRLL